MSSLENISIVLVRPRIPENIGSAVRVACNFGINSIILVRDEIPERESMAKTATHNTAHILNTMPHYGDLGEALQSFNYVIGTTARRGRKRFAERNPKQVVEHILPLITENRVAILFGPEDSGLSNEDLQYC